MGLTASHLLSSRLIVLLLLISLATLGASQLFQVPKSISSCWRELDECGNRSLFMNDAQYSQLKVDKDIEEILSSVKDRESLSEIAVRAFWTFRLSMLDLFPLWTFRGKRVFSVMALKPESPVGVHKVLFPFERKNYFYRRLCIIASHKILLLKKSEVRIAFFDLRKRTCDLVVSEDEICFVDFSRRIN